MRTLLFSVLTILFSNTLALAEVQTKTVDYTYDGATFKGFLAWNDSTNEKRPGILVVHEFWGLNDYARERAKQLA